MILEHVLKCFLDFGYRNRSNVKRRLLFWSSMNSDAKSVPISGEDLFFAPDPVTPPPQLQISSNARGLDDLGNEIEL